MPIAHFGDLKLLGVRMAFYGENFPDDDSGERGVFIFNGIDLDP
jgi:hypothetical protein